MVTIVGASLNPYVVSSGMPNFSWNAVRIDSGQSAPPTHTSVSDARSLGAISSMLDIEWITAGGPFHAVTRSSRIHSATPSGVDAVHDHRAPAGLARHQRGEHLHVEDGERQGVAPAEVVVVAAGGDEHRARHQQVVLAVHRALGVSGRAARVRDARGRVRIDLDIDRGVVRRHHRVLPHSPSLARTDDDNLDAVGIAELLGGRLVAQQQRRPTVGEQVLLLGRRRARG